LRLLLGAVDIASASGTRRPGFESRQVTRFLGKQQELIRIVCVLKKEICKGIGHKNIFFKTYWGWSLMCTQNCLYTQLFPSNT
jgi:hypothetical protein